VSRTVTITGGGGFLGQLLHRSLVAEGWRVDVYDRFRGPLVDLLRRRHMASATSPYARRAARAIRTVQSRTEPALLRARVLRPREDDILAPRDQLAARFVGSDVVIHMAGIPHPHWPGASQEDFVRLNYDASVNVFEAAREAGVPTFVFVSSAQVYGISSPVRLEQLPILESNYLPFPAEGQSTYGFLKAAFERYLAGACVSGSTQAVALRLEFPGFKSTESWNLFVSTSVENLLAGFSCAVQPPGDLGFGAFNLVDAEVDPAIVDIQAYVRERWPYVPNHTTGNQCLLSTEKAQRLLGYRPVSNGRYVDASLVW
jgi:NAD(P)-dependent dehydrogenase (short-subunit alcohol dehydrogenase family)